MYNPHILIDDIITEIEENSFKNLDNKKFFYDKISEYLQKDLVIIHKFKSQFKILRRIFNSERTAYILETCKEIKEGFNEGQYFDYLLKLISESITNKQDISINFISTITYQTESIIVEFIKRSYCIDDVKEFLNNIFDNYSFYDEKTLRTNFPHGIKSADFQNANGEFDEGKYNDAIVNIYQN